MTPGRTENDSTKLLGILALGITFLSFTSDKSKKPVLPVKGKVISPFGDRKHPITHLVEFHNGVDLTASDGTPVRSPWSGKVKAANVSEKGGNQIIILHNNGYKTGYAHLQKGLVNIGDKVRKGKIFAYTGHTGKVTEPHLHFTVTDPSGTKIDPETLFDF